MKNFHGCFETLEEPRDGAPLAQTRSCGHGLARAAIQPYVRNDRRHGHGWPGQGTELAVVLAGAAAALLVVLMNRQMVALQGCAVLCWLRETDRGNSRLATVASREHRWCEMIWCASDRCARMQSAASQHGKVRGKRGVGSRTGNCGLAK